MIEEAAMASTHLGNVIQKTSKMQALVNIIFVLHISYSIANNAIEQENYKVEQVQVLFRHGDRTPTQSYEGDPHEEIYNRYGYAQLTKIGKQRMFKIGQFLRERYNEFLGEYRHEDVYAYSTDYDRTKMSLQLVLAGLYPPSPSTSWSNTINWQPIPTHSEVLGIGFLSATHLCPEYTKLYEKIANTSKTLKVFQTYQDLFQRITRNTHINIPTLFDATPIYINLRATKSLGLPLPSWCSDQDFEKLEKISALVFKASTETELMRRMMAGPIVERFLNNSNQEESTKKIYLYAGHDNNVAAFIHGHNITGAPPIPDFGSTVIVEKLRGQDGRSYIRMYLWTGVSEELISLKLDNCRRTCPLTDYEKIAQSILPNKASRVCTPPKIVCVDKSNGIKPTKVTGLFLASNLTSSKSMKDLSPYFVGKS